MKVLVMGGDGKVGSALVGALRNGNEVHIAEINRKPEPQKFDVLHVAIPWQGDFVSKVNALVKEFKIGLTINHSTVAVGATKLVNGDAVHSPILGQHDDLDNEIYRFPKWIGCNDDNVGKRAWAHLSASGLEAYIFGGSDETELFKLLCLYRYFNELAFYETADRILSSLKVNKSLLNKWTRGYNKGYEGTKFKRSLLEFPKGKIGGTCVAQNSKMLYSITKDEGIKKNLEMFKLI